MKKSTQVIIWVVAIAIAAILVFLFVQNYWGAGAFNLVKSALTGETSAPVREYTCTTSGQVAPQCKGTCPPGQKCSFTGTEESCQCM